jgi:hypothetical protein
LSFGIVVTTPETSSGVDTCFETASQVTISMELVWTSTETLSRVAMSGSP